MEPNKESDRLLASKYEVVFCVFMAALAFLWRDNPELVYPQIQYFFLLLMALNLAAGQTLRLWPARPGLAAVLVLGNCGVITGILSYSGGAQSNLWVLYLMPIYTACLLLGAREVFWITAAAIAFNAAFHVLPPQALDAGVYFALATKSGLFVFAAAMTWKIVQRDQSTRGRLEEKRNQMQRLEDKILLQSHALEQAQDSCESGPLVSNIAHDLNNMIMVIMGFTKMVLQDKSTSNEARDDLQCIYRSAELCGGLATTLQKLASERPQPYSFNSCDIQNVIESALALQQKTLTHYRIDLRREFALNAPRIPASPSHLQRLFFTLIASAAKSMKRGGVLTVRTELRGEPSLESSRLLVIVEDTGLGFSEDLLKKLFKPAGEAMDSPQGAGTYLLNCAYVAEKHGGNIHAENRAGAGARVTLSLPCLRPSPRSARPAAPRREVEIC